jgi:hypothetical protein
VKCFVDFEFRKSNYEMPQKNIIGLRSWTTLNFLRGSYVMSSVVKNCGKCWRESEEII